MTSARRARRFASPFELRAWPVLGALVAWAWLLVVLQPAGRAAADEPAWKAGVASATITPKEPMWMAGYASRNRPSEGKLHDLHIKVLALEAADGHRGVVVSSDLLGFSQGMYHRICRELRSRCDLEPSQIMLTASHTHSGPVLADALYDIYPLDDAQKARIAEYSSGIEKEVVRTVAEALGRLAPATLHANEGVAEFAVNRRNNKRDQVSLLREQGIALAGPVDHGVSVLAVRSPNKALRAVVFGYACHATTLNSYEWSGDYPGFAQIALEEKHPGALAMFHAGCGADQNPLPRRTVELCRQYGKTLAAAVDDVLAEPGRPVGPQLQTALEILPLDFGEQPSREELEAMAKQANYRGRWATRLLKELDAGESFSRSYPYPVQAWKLGEKQVWIVLGGEVVVDYSLRFKAEHGPHAWVTGYANDVMSYIPSRRIWEEGGYESGAFAVYGLPATRWTPRIEDLISTCVERLLAESLGMSPPRK